MDMQIIFRDTPGSIEDIIKYDDPKLEAFSHSVVRALQKAGPIYRNHAGAAVDYDDLDFDLQAGYLNYYFIPMDSKGRSEAFETSLLAERKKKEWKWMEWKREQEKLRRAVMGKDVDEEVDEEASMADVPTTVLEKGGSKVQKVFPVVHSTSKQSIGNAYPIDRENSRSQPSLYERLLWSDASQTEVRRCQPGIERWWHPSKTRSAERIQEVRDAGLSIFTPYGLQVNRNEQRKHRDRWETDVVTKSHIARVLE